MTTLAGATKLLAEIITDVITGTATGGSTTTLADTARTEADNYWNGGCIWFTSGVAGVTGVSAAIVDYYSSTDTFAFATLAGAVAAGVTYAACTGGRDGFSRSVLQNAINAALAEVYIPTLSTSLTTVADQMSYDLPASVSRVYKVEVATSLTTPYEYQEHHHWWVDASKLYFKERSQPGAASYIIRLTYMAAHGALTTDTGAVSALVNDNWLKWAAAVHALRWKVQRLGEDTKSTKMQMLNEAIAKEAEMRARYPLPKMPQSPQYPVLDAGYVNEPSKVNSVRL